jgi:hypothetical protein
VAAARMIGGYTMARCANRARRTAGDRVALTEHTRVMSDPLDWAVRDQPLGSRPAPVTNPNAAYPPSYGPPPSRPPRRRTGLLIGVIVAVVMLIAAGGIGVYLLVNRAATFDAHFTLSVPGCASPGYEDITNGSQATLSDEHGTVLSIATLDVIGTCYWQGDFHKVPAGKTFYGIAIGPHRGTVEYTEAQLRDGAALSIG